MVTSPDRSEGASRRRGMRRARAVTLWLAAVVGVTEPDALSPVLDKVRAEVHACDLALACA